jgi:hypothetical protein
LPLKKMVYGFLALKYAYWVIFAVTVFLPTLIIDPYGLYNPIYLTTFYSNTLNYFDTNFGVLGYLINSLVVVQIVNAGARFQSLLFNLPYVFIDAFLSLIGYGAYVQLYLFAERVKYLLLLLEPAVDLFVVLSLMFFDESVTKGLLDAETSKFWLGQMPIAASFLVWWFYQSVSVQSKIYSDYVMGTVVAENYQFAQIMYPSLALFAINYA